MNCAVRVLALCLLLPAAQSFAKDFNKVAYVAGTLPLARFTKGQFEASDERECVIAWSGGKQQTRVPFGRIVFAEQGSYSSKNTLGPLGLDEKVHLYLTLIYRDDANRTQILEVELLGKYNGLLEQIRARAPVPLQTPPAEVTALAGSLGASIAANQVDAQIFSTTVGALPAHSKGVLRLNSEGIDIRTSEKDFHIGYTAIQSLEFGQKVGSRAVTAVLLSAIMMNELPMFLMKKRVRHLLTVTFEDRNGIQALVIELPKYSSRKLTLELELRSGKRVAIEPAKAGGIYG
jgi:hypothetical protein